MNLIIGGAWQGKLEYAKERFALSSEEIYECSADAGLDMDKRCFDHYERYLWYCMEGGVEPYTDFNEGCIIICHDVFCGVVPVDAKEREWRQLAGRTITALASKADSVTRIFCGIPMELKKGREICG